MTVTSVAVATTSSYLACPIACFMAWAIFGHDREFAYVWTCTNVTAHVSRRALMLAAYVFDFALYFL